MFFMVDRIITVAQGLGALAHGEVRPKELPLGSRFDVALWAPRPIMSSEGITMSLGTILLIILVLMLLGALPTWPHSGTWGYGPSGGLGLVLVIVVVLLLMGRL